MKTVLSVFLAASLMLGGAMLMGPAESGEVGPRVNALTPHAPIRINNDTDFVTVPGVANNATGNGTVWNPWIIENWEINGTGHGYCIYIGNTTEHFVVRNCTLHNASGVNIPPYTRDSGLSLYNASNAGLHNNTIVNCQDGIYLSHGSDNNTITWNTVASNTRWGIILDAGSHDNALENNSVTGNDDVGIYLYNSERNSLGFNNVSFNLNHGMWIYSASTNAIYNCTCMNNSEAGIYLYSGSNNNTVTASRAVNNGDGIRVRDSGGNIIYHNEVVNNNYQSRDNTGSNSWDDGYPSGGNYWSDYAGSDLFNGPDQNIPGGDGIGDLPYNITGGTSKDRYPLMAPFAGQTPGETVPPFALNYTPNGTAVPVDVPITITWNETMNWTSVEAAFEYTGGNGTWTSANGTWEHNYTTNVSVFTPAEPFLYETHYVVTVNSSAADIIGNMLDQNMNGTGGEWDDFLQWSFATDDEAPYVVSTQPAHGQFDVDPHKPFKIVFSESMNRTSVEAAFEYTDGNRTWNITDGDGHWNAIRTEFTFTSAEPLATNTSFTATLDGEMAQDMGGKGLKFGNHTWWFRTWLEPPAPKVVNTYPPDGASGVNVNTHINIVFDWEMDTQSVEDAFWYTDGATVWNIANGTVDWFSENAMLSFQPSERLKFDTEYTVGISSDAISIYGIGLDGNGNGIPDEDDDFMFSFTTTPEPPTVVSHYPGPNQRNVPIGLGAIYINFSTVMLVSSIINAVSISPVTLFTPALSGGGQNLTLRINADALLQSTEYRVTVLGTAVDMDGTKLDGNGDGWPGDRFSFSFLTVGFETVAPLAITHIFPEVNSTIPIDTIYIGVTFNAEMNRTSVQNAFSFSNESGEVNGTFTWSTTGRSFRFTPSGKLAYNTTYTVSVSGTAKDVDGRALGNTTTWRYITVSEESEKPILEWILYGTIIGLIALCTVLYMANRALRMNLKRTRVKLKRLKRQAGIKDEETGAAKTPEPGEAPEEIMPDGQSPDQGPSEESVKESQ